MSQKNSKVICIQGPTASGKSELAERIAALYDGELVSADSMQIYRGMDIGTAKVPVALRKAPYHCIDLIEPGEPYSAALFQNDARSAIEDIFSRGKLPILVGGTGLYVRAVLDDMNFAAGEQGDETRARLTELAEKLGPESLHAKLSSVDPESAALIHPNNVRRVIRALEMYEQGESYARRKNDFKRVEAFIPSIKVALDMDRGLLYERIDKRVDEMLGEGLLGEVEHLLEAGFREGLTAPQAIGYKELVSFLDGDINFDESIASIKQATRRYAKRQLSWLRSDPDIIWFPADEGITDTLVELVCNVIEKDLN